MRCIKLAGVSLIVIILASIGFFAVGGYNLAADQPHWSLTSSILDFIRERFVEVRSKNIEVPKNLDSDTRISQGAGLYAEMCVGCHLAPGIQNSELRKGLYPQPPALTHTTDLQSQETFYIISHGFKMTGMPAWGKSHTADQIWDMVAFLHKLPELTPDQYRTMIANADPHNHGQEHDHATMQEPAHDHDHVHSH